MVSDKPSKVQRNSPKRVDSSKERGYNNRFSKEVSSLQRYSFPSLFSMEVLRKLLFNIHLGHNPLRQDSFGPRELDIAKGPTRNEHPLIER